MNRYESLSHEIERILSDGMPDDFSGFGAVIYRGSLNDLPISPLMRDSVVNPPINQNTEIAKLLVSLSRYSDLRHDGFHFIHQGDGLTCLSLFVSPPIPANYKPSHYGVGARHRSAELISLMGEIEAVVVVERTGELRAFVDGKSRGVRNEE